MVDTGSPLILLSELPYTIPLESHCHLFGATGDALPALKTIHVDRVTHRNVWPTPVIVVSSLAHPLILGFNIPKLTKSKIDFDINNVEIGSKIHPADVHLITNSTFTITIPTSDINQPYQLLLSKKACWMTIFILITGVVATPVASHTHYHFKPPFKEPDKPIVSLAHTFSWKKLLPYGTSVCSTVRSQPARSKKASRLFSLDWTYTLPPFCAKTDPQSDNHVSCGCEEWQSSRNYLQKFDYAHKDCHYSSG